ncbi:MAG: DUF2924 domain-containing protein [Methylococcales bacterium]|mgnify:FL=1|jgi:hypothetical protein|nr:DUF2924 domain-containing protein [Methylococcales bacterium]MBT7444779.1 DUF2924 domain-containing protein [Methylococcales bacterium]
MNLNPLNQASDVNVAARVAALETMTVKELKALWLEWFSQVADTTSREYLISRLAYRVQELAYGGLSTETKKKLKDATKTGKSKNNKITMPPIGTQLIREYQGVEHYVTVIKEGFQYQGQIFKSLSPIAKQITGTKWSGPLFFGLKGK